MLSEWILRVGRELLVHTGNTCPPSGEVKHTAWADCLVVFRSLLNSALLVSSCLRGLWIVHRDSGTAFSLKQQYYAVYMPILGNIGEILPLTCSPSQVFCKSLKRIICHFCWHLWPLVPNSTSQTYSHVHDLSPVRNGHTAPRVLQSSLKCAHEWRAAFWPKVSFSYGQLNFLLGTKFQWAGSNSTLSATAKLRNVATGNHYCPSWRLTKGHFERQ